MIVLWDGARQYPIMMLLSTLLNVNISLCTFGLRYHFALVNPSKTRLRPDMPFFNFCSRKDTITLNEPNEEGINFGRQSYWNEQYQLKSSKMESDSSFQASFSWYSEWNDIEPFWSELVRDKDAAILVPGMGNDHSVIDMHTNGWKNITAFDYSSEGVSLARRIIGNERLVDHGGSIRCHIADARSLPYVDDSFDAVFDKGTLDAVMLSGGKDESLRRDQLRLAVGELARTVKSGGIVMSITAAGRATEEIDNAFLCRGDVWRMLRNSKDVYITDDGFASNSVDATILAWERL